MGCYGDTLGLVAFRGMGESLRRDVFCSHRKGVGSGTILPSLVVCFRVSKAAFGSSGAHGS